MRRALAALKKIGPMFFLGSFTAILAPGQITDDGPAIHAREIDRKRLQSIVESSERARPKLPKIKTFSGKLSKEQKKRIAPSGETIKKYDEFLRREGTGVVKILANPKCDLRVVDAGDLKCAEALPIPGMGSRYSFVAGSHISSFKTDIFYSDDNLSVGFTATNLGLIVGLGDRELDAVDPEAEEIRLLTNFLPPKSFAEIPKWKQLFEKGFAFKGKTYGTSAPVRLHTTYAMRSLNYYKVRYFRMVDHLDDITLAFRVVEIDPDGAVTLIWKKLRKDSGVKISK